MGRKHKTITIKASTLKRAMVGARRCLRKAEKERTEAYRSRDIGAIKRAEKEVSYYTAAYWTYFDILENMEEE